MARLAEKARPAGKVVVGQAELDRAANGIARAIDLNHGGLHGAPKFPQCAIFELLWRAGLRAPPEENPTRTAAPAFFGRVLLTLEHICEGGIYDHLGGGFARYSVDERWLVPHFEKMLYDNAQLLELLAVAHAATGLPLYRDRARETVGWLAREMTTPERGVSRPRSTPTPKARRASSTSGRTPRSMESLGPEDAAFFAAQYDVTPEGNFEGHNIFNRLKHLPRSMESAETPLRATRRGWPCCAVSY